VPKYHGVNPNSEPDIIPYYLFVRQMRECELSLVIEDIWKQNLTEVKKGISRTYSPWVPLHCLIWMRLQRP